MSPWLFLAIPTSIVALLCILAIAIGEDDEFEAAVLIGALASCFAIVGWIGVSA